MGNYEGLIECFEYGQVKPDPNYRDSEALLSSVKNNNFKIVDYLVKQGCNVNGGNNIAIKVAAKNKNMHMVFFLIENGADPNIYDGFPLIQMIRQNKYNLIDYLLKYKADINIAQGKPLVSAILATNQKMINYLIAHGADINLALSNKELGGDGNDFLNNLKKIIQERDNLEGLTQNHNKNNRILL